MRPYVHLILGILALAPEVGAQPRVRPASPPTERAFFASNAAAPGVIALPGLEYEVLRSGPAGGAHPKRTDEISVRYRGTFTDGRLFNASPEDGAGVTVFPLQKLIPGWVAALQLMRPGDVWRLYVPAYLGYGAVGKSYIPPESTLVFQVELVARRSG